MNKERDFLEKYRNMIRAKASAGGADGGARPKDPSDERLTDLIEEISSLRGIQDEINKRCEENKNKLEFSAELIRGYKDKIKRLESQKREIEDYKIKYEDLLKRFEERESADKGGKTEEEGQAPPDKFFIHLTREAGVMEKDVSRLTKMVKNQKKAYDEMCYIYQKRLVEAGLKKMDDVAVREAISRLKDELEAKDDIIQSLLQKRKINPEKERLIITWLSVMIKELREKNEAYRKRFGDLGDE